MKTLTEFPSFNLKNAAKLKHDLAAAGKTSEELPAALGESLKLEGDRLTFLLTSLEMAEKKLVDLKRVVVFSLSENEKAPPQAVQKGEHYYLVEYYTSMNQNPVSDRDEPRGRGGRGGRDGDKKKGGRGDSRGAPRSDRSRDGDRAPRPALAAGATAPTGQIIINPAKPQEERPRRPARPPRAPRPPAVAKGPDGRPLPTQGTPAKIVLPKGKIAPKSEAAVESAPEVASEVSGATPPAAVEENKAAE